MKKFMADHLGKLLLGSVLLAVVIWALCVYIPGSRKKDIVLCSVAGETIEMQLDLKWHNRMFSEDKISGEITVNGIKYTSKGLQVPGGATFTADVNGEELVTVFGHVYGKKFDYFEVSCAADPDAERALYYYPAANADEAIAMFLAIYGV